jgi:hypothetical protein
MKISLQANQGLDQKYLFKLRDPTGLIEHRFELIVFPLM